MPTPPVLPDAALLERYLAGECSPDEAAAVRAWVEAEETRRKTALGIKALDSTWVDRAAAPDVQVLWDRVVARAFGPRRAGSTESAAPARGTDALPRAVHRRATGGRAPARLQHPLRRALWFVSVAVLVATITGIGWRVGVNHAAQRVANSTITYTTGKGERANITLPDGSTVALNVASRLDVPADYATGHRTVHLTGQALFTVLHHAEAPFTVLAGGAAARVLGTSFVVRHYASDTTTLVAVRDGKVAVRSLVLAAGQQVEVDHAGVANEERAGSAPFSFAAGTLTLDSLTLAAAIPELDRWYDADIRLGDPSLATRRVTGECAAGSLADLTEYLAGTFNMRVARHGRVLTLYPR